MFEIFNKKNGKFIFILEKFAKMQTILKMFNN